MSFAKKRFGQNFLHDKHIIAKIIHAIQANKKDHVVEIGPGKAALTNSLLTAKRLDIIEIDNDLIPGLQILANLHNNLTLHHTDALTFDYASLTTSNQSLRIIGNLPYNISTPLIFHLLRYKHIITDMHFMLQKEVVDRICAQPGSKTYGRLSVMTQYYCEAASLFVVPATAFTPIPNVESAIIRLKPHSAEKLTAKNHDNLQTIVTQAFSQRRKTLRNTLKGFVTEQQLCDINIDPQQRPEQLSVQDYIKIANHY